MTADHGRGGEDGGAPGEDRRWITLPNLLGVLRLLVAPWLVSLGAAGRETAFLALFLGLTFTDWLDGKLAVWLDQRSRIGPRLDTLADAVMYAALLLGLVWLEGPVLAGEWPWIAAGVGSYGVSLTASMIAFRRLPSYHTRMAKTGWLLALVAAVALVAGGRVWPLRIAATAVTLANLEAVAVTAILDEPREDLSSVLQLLRERGSAGRGPESTGGRGSGRRE